MTKALIATHGHSASGMASTVKMFYREADIISLDAYVNGADENIVDDIKKFIDSVEEETAYIFTDIYGGSVNQQVLAELIKSKKKNIHLVSNANVPSIIELLMHEESLSTSEVKSILESTAPSVVEYVQSENLESCNEEDYFLG